MFRENNSGDKSLIVEEIRVARSKVREACGVQTLMKAILDGHEKNLATSSKLNQTMHVDSIKKNGSVRDGFSSSTIRVMLFPRS